MSLGSYYTSSGASASSAAPKSQTSISSLIPSNISSFLNNLIRDFQLKNPFHQHQNYFESSWLVHYNFKQRGTFLLPTPIRGIVKGLGYFGRDPVTGSPTILLQAQQHGGGGWSFMLPVEFWGLDCFIVRKCLSAEEVYHHHQQQQISPFLVLFRNPKTYTSVYMVNKENVTFTTEDLVYYLCLVWENPDFGLYLRNDYAYVTSDKYLIAMGFLYLIGAKYPMDYFNVTNLLALAAVFLANEFVEECPTSISTARYVISYFTRTLPLTFTQAQIKQRVDLLRQSQEIILQRLQYHLHVNQEACEQVIDIFPLHPVWARDRNNYQNLKTYTQQQRR